MKLTDINPPLGADYVIYRVGHGRNTEMVIVARDDGGQWERVGRIPPYLLQHLLEGMIRTDIAVWDADEKSYLNGTALQMVYVPRPAPPPPPKPPAKNLEQAGRNWAIWRERVTDGTTYAALGSKYGVHGGRAQQIFKKCSRQIRTHLHWPNNASDRSAATYEEALRGFEIVWPREGRPHLIAPNGKRIDL